MLLLYFGICAYLFSLDERSCCLFSTRNNCCGSLSSYGVIIHSVIQSINNCRSPIFHISLITDSFSQRYLPSMFYLLWQSTEIVSSDIYLHFQNWHKYYDEWYIKRVKCSNYFFQYHVQSQAMLFDLVVLSFMWFSLKLTEILDRIS